MIPETSPWWGLYVFFKVIFIIIDLAMVVGFVYALVRGWSMRPKFYMKEVPEGKRATTLRDVVMKERWQSIITKFSVGTPESMRLAIIDADAFVDTALKGMNIEGEHLADRLSNLETEDIKSMNGLWRAHRMRNDLVHTPGFAISLSDVKLVMGYYEAFLKEIEVL